MSGTPAETPATALVVFVDRAECAWLRLLRPGFRHCFAALRREDLWLVCDPLLDRIELAALALPPDFDLARFYTAAGHVVLSGRARHTPSRPRLPSPTPLTCVSVVKRLLGVRAPGVLTPWHLFRHLTMRGDEPFTRLDAPGPRGRHEGGGRRIAPQNSILDIGDK